MSIYVKNINGTFNYTEPIIDTVEIELFLKNTKKFISTISDIIIIDNYY